MKMTKNHYGPNYSLSVYIAMSKDIIFALTSLWMLAKMKECTLQTEYFYYHYWKSIVEDDGWHRGSTAERKPVRSAEIIPVSILDAIFFF
jgi:hypothetical protein